MVWGASSLGTRSQSAWQARLSTRGGCETLVGGPTARIRNCGLASGACVGKDVPPSEPSHAVAAQSLAIPSGPCEASPGARGAPGLHQHPGASGYGSPALAEGVQAPRQDERPLTPPYNPSLRQTACAATETLREQAQKQACVNRSSSLLESKDAQCPGAF